MGNTLKEIKKVGLKDWLWFVVWLKRDGIKRLTTALTGASLNKLRLAR